MKTHYHVCTCSRILLYGWSLFSWFYENSTCVGL